MKLITHLNQSKRSVKLSCTSIFFSDKCFNTTTKMMTTLSLKNNKSQFSISGYTLQFKYFKITSDDAQLTKIKQIALMHFVNCEQLVSNHITTAVQISTSTFI